MNINGEFASINGKLAIINGTPPLKAIVAASEAYPKGWHEGDVGGLSAIETDLAPANIKEAVNIFGKVGTLTVALTERIAPAWVSGNEAAWTTYLSASIPSTETLVIAVATAMEGGLPSESVPIQILYNGVQKAYASGPPQSGPICAWGGEGIGSTADLELQAKRGGIQSYVAKGAAYSVG